MKHIFIIAPAAGKKDRTGEYRREIEAVCGSRGLAYEILVSQKPGDCAALAKKAAETGEELRLYACGGDGTLNEVVSGAAGFENVAVTHYPGGSGNDFIKNFSETAPFSSLERLLDCEEASFDLMRCNEDWALNICSMGFDARVGTEIARYKRLPFVSGTGAYLLSTVVNWIKGISQHYVVEIDGQVFDEEFSLICVANGRHYGGSFHPVPDADLADGLLDVLLVKKVTRLKVLEVIQDYQKGHYAQFPDLIRHIRTDRLTIRADKPSAVNLDGELRMADRVEMAVSPVKLRFFYPKGLTWQAEAQTQTAKIAS